MIELMVLPREVYGNRVYYPANAAAKALAKIAGTKTLTAQVLDVAMKELGAAVVLARPSDLARFQQVAA